MTTQHILIVEDDIDTGNIYRRVLENAGYSVTLNQSGENVIALLQEEKPDLLILDIHLPYAWGPETVKRVRDIPEIASTKILVTTVDVIVGHKLSDAGETVLFKPIGFDRLRKAVEELLLTE